MNVTLSGAHPEFEGRRFSVRGREVIVDGEAEGSAGLATAIVRALGGELPEGSPRERRIEVEQTNRSVVVADRWIVKLIAEFGTADRSALIEQRLADSDVSGIAVPPFLGGMVWDHPELGRSTIALASGFVHGAEDGWTWGPDDVIRDLPERDPDWPARLGTLTARLHAALASAEFPADRGKRIDRAAAVSALLRDVETRFASSADPIGARIRNRLPALREALRGAGEESRAPGIVIHGDLHVGQVLRDPGGNYSIVDFDGDPQWGSTRPWRRDPAARDVAHMLVSIDLVAAVAQKRAGGADASYFSWADRARAAFLDAYRAELASAGRAGLFEAGQLPGLCAEQLLLELRYAARYQPSWEYAPDCVISHRYPSTQQESETPWTSPDSQTI